VVSGCRAGRNNIAAAIEPPTVCTVIVAHNSVGDLRRSLPPLLLQLEDADELIVVDSGSTDGLADALADLAPAARLIAAPGNIGFAGGANLGAAAATTELIVFLNPDAVVQRGWASAIRAPLRSGEWGAWMALIAEDDGTIINTSGGVLYFTGIGWAGQAGQPIRDAPRSPMPVGFLSGACLSIPAATWRALGGFSEHYFMYCEDVDLSLRLRLLGKRIGVMPDAVAIHAYDFDKGAAKWRLLERNRWATIVRTYPTPLLVLLVPALFVTELAVWGAAMRGHWARMKMLATLDLLWEAPRLARERRLIQRSRRVTAAAFASPLTDELSSPYLGSTARSRLLAGMMRRYWALVRRLLAAKPQPQ
jgi:GT2 family glycosyltransferase